MLLFHVSWSLYTRTRENEAQTKRLAFKQSELLGRIDRRKRTGINHLLVHCRHEVKLKPYMPTGNDNIRNMLNHFIKYMLVY
jgi:hypothetical protein